jgi:ParB family chromosome partitioning protein
MNDVLEQIKIPKLETRFEVLSLDLIDDPARPLRSDLSPESVEDLVASIKQVGIIEPLVVKEVGKRFEVIAGHRRLVAATIAGLALVPCYVVKADPQISEVLKMHENLFRREISPVDEAKFYDFLIQHYKLTPAKIAAMINKSQSYVLDRLDILEYPEELRQALQQKQIEFSVAREFSRVSDVNTMRKFLHYAIRSGITTALARQWVDEWKRSLNPVYSEPSQVPAPSPQGTEYITYVQCIYCRQDCKLFDAQTVYIHPHCLNEVLTEPTSQNR